MFAGQVLHLTTSLRQLGYMCSVVCVSKEEWGFSNQNPRERGEGEGDSATMHYRAEGVDPDLSLFSSINQYIIIAGLDFHTMSRRPSITTRLKFWIQPYNPQLTLPVDVKVVEVLVVATVARFIVVLGSTSGEEKIVEYIFNFSFKLTTAGFCATPFTTFEAFSGNISLWSVPSMTTVCC